jgi:hypothetical protein
MQRSILIPLLLALTPACAAFDRGTSASMDTSADAKAAFERIKGLSGSWSGVGGTEMPNMDVNYRVTAGGSTVEETLFPGTPHEMVTMYHLDGDRIMLTHYCALGNQPTMVGSPVGSMRGDVATIRFQFASATNLASPQAGHMHDAEMTFEGKDRVVSTWTFWKDGKREHDAKFELTRKSGS